MTSSDLETTGADASALFTPFATGPLTMANRFVMAPMTRQHSPGGVPGRDVAEYYARRAHLGLIITEGTYVDHPSAGASADVPRLYGEASLDGWREVVTAVHDRGGKIIPQLWHVGAARPAGAAPHPQAPVLTASGTAPDGSAHGTAATIKDIDEVVAGFARSAKNAQAIGFDGLELHGAHGYLLDDFFWKLTNRRTDAFGGDISGRVKLSTEIVRAVRAEVGPDLPIVYRFSQWKARHYDARFAETPGELERFLAPLVEAGVSVWHASTRRHWLPGFDGSELTLAGWAKKLTGLPTILLGSVGVRTIFGGAEANTAGVSLAPLVRRFEAGEFDLIGVGRAVLSDPEWMVKVRDGRADEIRRYEKGHEATLY
ncbi:2,4-dienoyl-CoA reductase-like NADH-dependent reductase (Old Yellow Enzyme family) [Stackebrandtia endophytica]|uniref:2,4-dienoyl-CoA reductase-like NADH-dependent reductase (Old Yellow Enzyme family) n=1 Tax=Stackebrandtia endophytica TaxID=1496996 RepID=A0A543AWR6_9ACTN|nr:NADH:flavin oxidoreductase [Stackebrandtia endophytica]TQL76999.1 2,4-dienoyl-CoA reductase-like NADH-dependent reductase (Old Yellow Enzyme family) [Stackebrandtia endophytica]